MLYWYDQRKDRSESENGFDKNLTIGEIACMLEVSRRYKTKFWSNHKKQSHIDLRESFVSGRNGSGG